MSEDMGMLHMANAIRMHIQTLMPHNQSIKLTNMIYKAILCLLVPPLAG